MSSVVTKHFPTISSGLNFQWAMSLGVMDKVATIVWSEFTDCWSKGRDRFNWIWGPVKMYKYTKFSITRNLTYLNWVTWAKTSSMSFLFKSPITKSIRIWINPEAANAIRTQLERFQVSLDGHKKWMSYSSKDFGFVLQRLSYSFKSAKTYEAPILFTTVACSMANSAVTRWCACCACSRYPHILSAWVWIGFEYLAYSCAYLSNFSQGWRPPEVGKKEWS